MNALRCVLALLGTLSLSSAQDPVPDRRLPAERQILGLAFSPDGRFLVLACDEKGSLLYSLDDGAIRHRLGNPVPGLADRAASFVPKGDRIILGGIGPALRIFDPAKGREQETPEDPPADLRALAVSPDGAILAGGGSGSEVLLWNLGTGKRIRTLAGPKNTIRSVAWSADGRRLAAVSDDGALWIWNTPAGELHRRVEATGAKFLVAAFAAKSTLAAGHTDGGVLLWDAESGAPTKVLRKAGEGPKTPCLSLAVHPKEEIVASGYFDGTIRFTDFSSGEERGRIKAGTGKALSIAFSADGTRFASSQGFTWAVADLWGKGK